MNCKFCREKCPSKDFYYTEYYCNNHKNNVKFVRVHKRGFRRYFRVEMTTADPIYQIEYGYRACGTCYFIVKSIMRHIWGGESKQEIIYFDYIPNGITPDNIEGKIKTWLLFQ